MPEQPRGIPSIVGVKQHQVLSLNIEPPALVPEAPFPPRQIQIKSVAQHRTGKGPWALCSVRDPAGIHGPPSPQSTVGSHPNRVALPRHRPGDHPHRALIASGACVWRQDAGPEHLSRSLLAPGAGGLSLLCFSYPVERRCVLLTLML